MDFKIYSKFCNCDIVNMQPIANRNDTQLNKYLHVYSRNYFKSIEDQGINFNFAISSRLIIEYYDM